MYLWLNAVLEDEEDESSVRQRDAKLWRHGGDDVVL